MGTHLSIRYGKHLRLHAINNFDIVKDCHCDQYIRVPDNGAIGTTTENINYINYINLKVLII